MEELVNEMTDDNPARCPLIEEVVVKLARIRQSLSGCKLRSIIKSRQEPIILPLMASQANYLDNSIYRLKLAGHSRTFPDQVMTTKS